VVNYAGRAISTDDRLVRRMMAEYASIVEPGFFAVLHFGGFVEHE
jgi:hypothetical protein